PAVPPVHRRGGRRAAPRRPAGPPHCGASAGPRARRAAPRRRPGRPRRPVAGGRGRPRPADRWAGHWWRPAPPLRGGRRTRPRRRCAAPGGSSSTETVGHGGHEVLTLEQLAEELVLLLDELLELLRPDPRRLEPGLGHGLLVTLRVGRRLEPFGQGHADL